MCCTARSDLAADRSETCAPPRINFHIMKTRKPRDIEKTYPVRAFAAKLRRLADALEAGRPFPIRVAGERLHIPADARFNIEHEREGGREELEFQLLWRRPAAPRGGPKPQAAGEFTPRRDASFTSLENQTPNEP